VKPAYDEDNFRVYLAAKLVIIEEELGEVDEELWKLEQKYWFTKRNDYAEKLVKMFNDMILHFSDESANLIKVFQEDLTTCTADKDPRGLLKLVKKSHTQSGRVVSREEKESKKDRLKNHRQWDKNGKVYDIHSHNRLFKDLLDETEEVGIVWDDDDIVDMYLKSVDNSLFVSDLARIKVPGSAEMPKTLEQAQFWVIEANRRNQSIRDNRPANHNKRKSDDLSTGERRVQSADIGVPAPTSDYPECAFCKKHHLGGAQECAYLKLHLKEHEAEVAATLTKKVNYPPPKRTRSGRGGKGKGGRGGKGRGGGRGGGRNGGKGRGGGRGKGAENTALHATESSSTDDTWTDFQREQALNEIFHYKVTVFKTGKASMQQKQNSLTYLYDNGATLNLFCNENVMWDVENVQPIRIDGIGNVWVTRRGMSLFGPAYVLASLPFNIVAEQEIIANDKVSFDSSKSSHYYVNGVQWTRQKDGLLTCTHKEARRMTANRLKSDPLITEGHHDAYLAQYVWALETLPDGSYYNAQQRRRAAEVRRIHEILNHPSDDILGILFDRGAIHGCPYTSRDVRIMRKIYGPCVACVKGKSVRATPGKVINQWVAAAPGERLCMDIFFLSVVTRKSAIVSLPFLIVVDDYTQYVNIMWLTSRTTETVLRALTEIIKFYYGYDWCVKEVCGDRDSVFKPLKDKLFQQHKVQLDVRATDQKIPRADRMIRTIRDIFRTIKASLWYKLPQFLYPHFIEDAAHVWNVRPNARTVDRSPREIVEGKKLEFDQHIKTAVGTVAEFYVPATKRQLTSKEDREVKKNEERTATGIVTKRNFDSTGTLEIYDIDGGSRINRCKVKLVRKPSSALRAQIKTLTPDNEVVDNDLILPVPRLTQSNKRNAASLEPSRSDVVTDTQNRRGDNNNDASDAVVEQNLQSTDANTDLQSTDAGDDMPLVRSTDDTEKAAPTELETIEEDEHLVVNDDNNSDIINELVDEQTVTGVQDDNELADEQTITGVTEELSTSIQPPLTSSNTDTDTTSSSPTNPLTNRDDTQSDYPRRPGKRKLTREPPAAATPATSAPPPVVRSRRMNAGKQPPKYTYMAGKTVNIEHQFQEYVYTAGDNLTITQAKLKHPTRYMESLHSELRQFHDMAVGRPIKEEVRGLKHSKVIGCKGFYREVNDLRTGMLKKLKFRVVPQGHLLNRALYEPKETTSPTVTMESIFAVINIAAKENRKGFTMDIPGAYLNAELKDKHMVKFPKDLAAEYVALYPEYAEYLQPDGTMLMLIEKALYGLVESSALWYKEIKAFLLSLGYVVHASDMGVFQKKVNHDVITICLWVDDFLGFSTNRALIDELKNRVTERFGDARFDDGKILNYIGMTISQPKNNVITVKQVEFIKKIVQQSGVTLHSQSPNHPGLMQKKDKNTIVPLHSSTRYLSLIMSAMFLAKRTRPEILTPVCILASRVQAPDSQDMKYLLRVYEYLNSNIDIGLRYHPTNIQLFYWIDASYNLHEDSRGQSGIIATVGRLNAPIYVRSQKQKLHTRSSTESELVATDEGVLHLLWMVLVFEFLGYPQTPVTVFQDNQSTIRVCQTGHSKNGRLKHMVVRYNFIHGQQEANIITFKYIKSSNMLADILTKPLEPTLFVKFRNMILNLP
jgi:hypothetical protein